MPLPERLCLLLSRVRSSSGAGRCRRRCRPVTRSDISFLVDSNNFVDGTLFPTRGYVIDESSFSMTTGPTDWGLQNPYMGVPYFILRDNDPAVDGFLFGSDPDVGFPNGVALDQFGIIEQFRANYATTYGGDTLSSLDIVDAVGTYDFDGLTVFSFGILDGGFDAAGFIFEQMTISIVPEPSAFGLLMVGLVAFVNAAVK